MFQALFCQGFSSTQNSFFSYEGKRPAEEETIGEEVPEGKLRQGRGLPHGSHMKQWPFWQNGKLGYTGPKLFKTTQLIRDKWRIQNGASLTSEPKTFPLFITVCHWTLPASRGQAAFGEGIRHPTIRTWITVIPFRTPQVMWQPIWWLSHLTQWCSGSCEVGVCFRGFAISHVFTYFESSVKSGISHQAQWTFIFIGVIMWLWSNSIEPQESAVVLGGEYPASQVTVGVWQSSVVLPLRGKQVGVGKKMSLPPCYS